mmetsp:Transcript_20690/g.44076  ORF Transcript_20690/g.44076 Transcript_20690/m.44076 type:complete len:302 (-) Transcript_20690:132-1037(-)
MQVSQILGEGHVGLCPLLFPGDHHLLGLLASLHVPILVRIQVQGNIDALALDTPLRLEGAGTFSATSFDQLSICDDPGAVVQLLDVHLAPLKHLHQCGHSGSMGHNDEILPGHCGLLDIGLHAHDATLVPHLHRLGMGQRWLPKELEATLWEQRVDDLNAQLLRHFLKFLGRAMWWPLLRHRSFPDLADFLVDEHWQLQEFRHLCCGLHAPTVWRGAHHREVRLLVHLKHLPRYFLRQAHSSLCDRRVEWPCLALSAGLIGGWIFEIHSLAVPHYDNGLLEGLWLGFQEATTRHAPLRPSI